ncbi:cytochrome c-type biogenesis protein CcmF [Rhodobium gokarnense]|uniref:Cytochrome c-type biogenesis protein n=1 Tax=Rhodobium gokarnense TaxID=364296 RepID=A0ABT3HEV8_9HYPH|nr:cytochrome c-type biogenesis protein CcmF [Rhodobium gokarnense]
MIVEFGHFALCLALVVALAQAVVPLIGVARDHAGAMQLADRAAQVQFLAIAAAFAALTWAYVQSDFSVATVAANSHSTKPLLYKISGVWANHEGSMLLWVLMLALFGALIALFGGNIPTSMRARVLSVQAMIGTGFLAFILVTSNPFLRLATPPIDGQGMNPLLQDPGIAIHPPFLYLGYVGFSTAFSFAVGALLAGRIDPSWARWMRPFILVAWAGLTLGIALGSWWAYYELGWGGFWFWDPVENASFMPWLLGTALLHSAMVAEKRDALQKWTILLAILTFSLSLIGTFLVRSGVLSSVHAFAQDPERGVFILGLLALAIGGSLGLFAYRAAEIRGGGLFQPVSREGGLLLNNLLLAAACGTVFMGTLYPLFLEITTGARITVGAPFFNLTFVPMFLPVAFVAGIGPFLTWKRADLSPLARRLRALFGLVVAGAVVVAFLDGFKNPFGVAGLAVGVWLLLATLFDLSSRAGFRRAGLLTGLRRLIGLPRTAWGLLFGHAGLAIAICGIALASTWSEEAIQVQRPGETVSVGGYDFTLLGVKNASGPNYRSEIATIEVARHGEIDGVMKPERRWYPVEAKATTEAAIDTRWHGDLYAVIGEPDGNGGFVTRYYYNAGVAWMWVGAIVMALGGLVSLTDRRLRVGAPSRPRTGKGARPKLGRRGGHAAVAAGTITVIALGLAVLAAHPATAAGLQADEFLADPKLEEKARDIGKELRCLVCQNQSIFDSNATLAHDLRVLVRERVAAGDDADSVKQYVVARYGDYVLLQPPVKPLTYVLWVAPALFLVLALLLGQRVLAAQTRAGAPGLSDAERARAKEILKGDAA